MGAELISPSNSSRFCIGCCSLARTLIASWASKPPSTAATGDNSAVAFSTNGLYAISTYAGDSLGKVYLPDEFGLHQLGRQFQLSSDLGHDLCKLLKVLLGALR
jgi:hypothetical protein